MMLSGDEPRRYFHHFCRECKRNEYVFATKGTDTPMCHGRMAFGGVVVMSPDDERLKNVPN